MKIKNIKILEKKIALKNMVLIVGANGTGKSKLLYELQGVISDRDRQTSYWGDIEFEEATNDNDFTNWFNSLSHVYNRGNKNTTVWTNQFSRESISASSDGAEITEDQYKNLQDKTQLKEYFNTNVRTILKEFIHYLRTDTRLVLGHTDQVPEAYQNIIYAPTVAHDFPEILRQINKYTGTLFGKKIEVAMNRRPNFELRVTDVEDPKIPPDNIKNRNKSLEEYRKWLEDYRVVDLDMEGDGVRSFLGIMFNYCLPTNQVLMIDEPELHLYPAIKREFGRILGNLAKNDKKQIICATHDSDFLQGVCDSGCDTSILKLTRVNKEHKITDIQYSSVPKQSQSRILQIPFFHCAIFVEGDDDRRAYQHLFKSEKFLDGKEYLFLPVHGKGRMGAPSSFAQELDVPYAVILDIDSLKESNVEKTFKRIARLKGDKTLLATIVNLSVKIKNINNFGKMGLAAIVDTELKREIKGVISSLCDKGVFIVPCGKLESWPKIFENDLENDLETSERVIRKYENNKQDSKILIDFLKKVEDYLSAEMS